MFSYAFRAFSAFLTTIYLLAAAGSCSVLPTDENVSATSPGVPEEPSRQVSVNILQSMPEASMALLKAGEQYAASTGDSVVFHVQTVSGEDYRAALRTKLLAGEPVDLFHLTGVDDVQRLSPLLGDLSPSMPWVEDAAGNTLEAVTKEGSVYGIPYSLEGIGLIANRRIFEEAGIDLTQINDYESMSEAFFELRDKIDAGELAESFPDLEAVTDLAAQDAVYMGGTVSELLLSESFSSPAQAYQSAFLSMPDAEDAGNFMLMFARNSAQRLNWSTFPSITQQRIVEGGLAAERVAVILHNTEIYNQVYDANPDLQGQLALLPVYYENAEQGMVFTGAPVWWGVRAGADDATKQHAQGLLSWLYHSEVGGQALAEEFGILSPYRDTAATTGVALHSQLLTAIDSGLSRPQLASSAPSGWNDVFAAQMNEYFTVYDKEWSDVVDACAGEWAARRD